jgi:Cupin-like domain
MLLRNEVVGRHSQRLGSRDQPQCHSAVLEVRPYQFQSLRPKKNILLLIPSCSVPAMPGLIRPLSRTSRIRLRPYSSSSNGFNTRRSIDTIAGPFAAVNLSEFRSRAFIPEKPVLIRTANTESSTSYPQSLPAARKWFAHESENAPNLGLRLSERYLSLFWDTILPYELIIDSKKEVLQNYIDWAQAENHASEELVIFLVRLLSGPDKSTFRRFYAPLSLFLQACRETPPHITPPRLYIAQAQISDLPKQLQDDLPTPHIVKEAGKGDIYDANIWMGIPPTYTPLHKDPNPNLFVQLASSKSVRLFRPDVGSVMFRDVQHSIGRYGSASFRGDEMMEGPEKDALDEVVWGRDVCEGGYETTINPGDALFIPKGWWHSIRSIGSGVTGSVNWWFR